MKPLSMLLALGASLGVPMDIEDITLPSSLGTTVPPCNEPKTKKGFARRERKDARTKSIRPLTQKRA